MTVTEFKELYPVLRSYPAKQISSVLKKHGILTDRKRKDNKVQRVAILPRPKDAYKFNI